MTVSVTDASRSGARFAKRASTSATRRGAGDQLRGEIDALRRAVVGIQVEERRAACGRTRYSAARIARGRSRGRRAIDRPGRVFTVLAAPLGSRAFMSEVWSNAAAASRSARRATSAFSTATVVEDVAVVGRAADQLRGEGRAAAGESVNSVMTSR